jgi:hypothetical protein
MGFSNALNEGDDLSRFDSAEAGDLSAFDAATGETHIPAGWYLCSVACGEVVTTKKGKAAYRLVFDVVDGPHSGYRLWRYYTFDSPAAANRAKAALAPFGLATSVDLRKPFPGPNRVITLQVLVTAQERPGYGTTNDVERFTIVSDQTSAPNPNAVSTEELEGGGSKS